MGARRGSGEGSVYRRQRTRRTKTGEASTITTWVATVEAGRDAVTGRRRRVEVAGRTKAAALAKAAEARRQVDSGLAIDRTMTVGAFLDSWVTTVLANRVGSDNTITNYAQTIRAHLAPALGSVTLARLTPEQVDRMLQAKADAGLSRNYVNRMRSVLADALTHAEARGLVTRNAARLAVMPKCKPTPPRRSLTGDEARALLAAADATWTTARNEKRTERQPALIATGLMLGLRPGELTGLRWADLNLDAEPPTLTVSGSMKRTPKRTDDGAFRGYQLVRGDVKRSKAGQRTVALPLDLAGRLRAHRRRQAEERLAVGDLWQDQGLVFCSEIGTPLDPSAVRRTFTRCAERAGLEGGFPYQLRHTAVSLLVDAGVPLDQVADLVGDDPRTVLLHYRHRVRPVTDAAVEPMGAIFGTAT